MSMQLDLAFVKAYYDEMWSSTSVSCLVIYEFLATFLDEIRVVWMTPIAASTVLLGSVRYTMLVSAAIQVLATPTTVEGCQGIVVLTHVLNLIAFAQTALFSALRTFAIGNRNYYLSIVVFLLGMVPFATNLMLTAIATYGYVPLPPPVGPTCYSDAPISVWTSNIMTYATRGSLMLSDVLVLVLTWIKTFGQWRSARKANVRVSLTTCLLRDGTVYFVILLACNMAHMLTFNLSVIDESPTGGLITVLPSVLINRFIINLRTINSEVSDFSVDIPVGDQHSRPPTLQFRRQGDPLGNMGGSLHDGWTEEPWDADDVYAETAAPGALGEEIAAAPESSHSEFDGDMQFRNTQ